MKKKRKCIKVFYWSTLNVGDDQIQKKYNPSKAAATAYAKRVGGFVKIVHHRIDEGIEYRIYR